jgi:hypothetical protein
MRAFVIPSSKWPFVALLATLACDKTTQLAGTPPPDQQIDVFQQLARAQSDILWVIDNSGSMAREQDQLADSFPKFFAYLQTSQVDYRIGVTTTDVVTNPSQAGDLVGTPSIIVGNSQDTRVPDTADPQSAFAANIHVGTSGSARDEALEAALTALQKLQAQAEQAADAGQPILFLRPEAALFLIFVGDGVDYSPDYDLTGVQYYWREYLQAKGIGNNALVQVAAIAGDLPNGCTPDCATDGGADGGLPDGGAHDFSSGVSGEAALPGVRYYELVELAQGVFGSICDCSFDTTLEELGVEALGLTTKFRLSRQADPTSLSLVVNYPCNTPDPADNLICSSLSSTCEAGYGDQCDAGCTALNLACTVPQITADGGSTDGWIYNPGDNSVTFSPSTLPPGGTQITVTYDVGGST